jgi:hypothetical protein
MGVGEVRVSVVVFGWVGFEDVVDVGSFSNSWWGVRYICGGSTLALGCTCWWERTVWRYLTRVSVYLLQ